MTEISNWNEEKEEIQSLYSKVFLKTLEDLSLEYRVTIICILMLSTLLSQESSLKSNMMIPCTKSVYPSKTCAKT